MDISYVSVDSMINYTKDQLKKLNELSKYEKINDEEFYDEKNKISTLLKDVYSYNNDDKYNIFRANPTGLLKERLARISIKKIEDNIRLEGLRINITNSNTNNEVLTIFCNKAEDIEEGIFIGEIYILDNTFVLVDEDQFNTLNPKLPTLVDEIRKIDDEVSELELMIDDNRDYDKIIKNIEDLRLTNLSILEKTKIKAKLFKIRHDLESKEDVKSRITDLKYNKRYFEDSIEKHHSKYADHNELIKDIKSNLSNIEKELQKMDYKKTI